MQDKNSPGPLEPVSPAAAQKIAISPQLVELCQKNPEILVELARGQLAIVQDRLVRMAIANPEATVSQLAAVHEQLSKIARVGGKEQGVGGGQQQVVINIIRGAGKEKVVIEGEATRVEAPSE